MKKTCAFSKQLGRTRIIALGLVLGFAALFGPAAADVPQLISFQGRIVDANGQPLADGSYSMTFKIFDAPTHGSQLWSETQAAVSVTNGLFSVMLGSVTSLSSLTFNQDYWLEITVGANVYSPRQRLSSSAYALNVPDLRITTGKLANAAVTTAKIADLNVTTAKIADLNVTTAKIADLNVTTAKIADLNVTTAKIADLNVTTAKIADLNVTTPKIADGAVTNPKLATDAVTTTKILDGEVGTADIANLAVTNAKISEMDWVKLQTYPAACAGGQFVTAVGDALTCATPSPSSGGGWTDNGTWVGLTTSTDTVTVGGTAAPPYKLEVAGTLGVNSAAAADLTLNETTISRANPGSITVDMVGTAADSTLTVTNSNVTYKAGIAIEDANTRLSQGGGNALRLTTDSGFVEVGPQNAYWSHFYTDRPRYYFNQGIQVDTGNIGSYDENLSLQTSGTTRVTIDNVNGNVGIGTATPAAGLHIRNANIDSTPDVSGVQIAGGGWASIELTGSAAGVGGYIDFQEGNIFGKNFDGRIILRPDGFKFGTTSENNLVINRTNGRVGIGTATQSYLLHVAGDIYANGGWLRVSGNGGLYFESWGGGWHMTDASWIRAYNNKPVYTAGVMRADAGFQVGGLPIARKVDYTWGANTTCGSAGWAVVACWPDGGGNLGNPNNNCPWTGDMLCVWTGGF